ncbi:MAG: DUF2185 domain-containing protein [Oscillospiraceae bacterium]|nr:DUF2185 domain-containing protein [Oscillospiraceae bacterium]
MENKMAVITKRAYNARHIGTIQYTNECFDDKDSGWRLFYGDEDDHVLDRMECFRIITLKEAMEILPELESLINNTKCTYYHFSEDGFFNESDSFESYDTQETDPFLKAFMK